MLIFIHNQFFSFLKCCLEGKSKKGGRKERGGREEREREMAEGSRRDGEPLPKGVSWGTATKTKA